MFDNIINKITSPSSGRRRYTYHCPEVHSDPEDSEPITPRKPRLLERKKRGRRGSEGLRQARSLGRLDGLKEAEKLADYGKLLGGSQPSLDGRRKDLDRIQELFPQDYLSLHTAEINSCSMKTKSFRKKSFVDLQSTENLLSSSPSNRKFLVEAPCAMSSPHMPMAAKPRHLFLFSDLLLVAKPRNGGTFKLKDRVRVSELWLAPHQESETGFLLGWPTPAKTFLVTFCTQAARDSWWRQLQQSLTAQLRLEPQMTNIKVVYRDPLSGTECSKTLGIGPETNSHEIARMTLDDSRTNWGYTLWARDRDNAPCPLIGIERPHSIQLARLRQSICAEEGFDLMHCNNNRIFCDIVFELKPNCKPPPRKTPLKLFKKNNLRIFGVPLNRICSVNGALPPFLNVVLKCLYQRGLHTQGIFRRCASARALRELRDKIDTQNGNTSIYEELSNTPALLLAALLKDFLRSLPEPLLSGNAQEWLNVANTGRIEGLRRLLNHLPRENHILLAHIICLLHHISKKARYNLMSSTNLGVCVGPSLLWEPNQNAPMRTLPTLIELLINHCQILFGPLVTTLLGGETTNNNDSGAEENDSLHCMSLDSIELSKDQKSLSRDSGLTLSEDDRDSPSLNYNHVTFHRFDWTRQAARVRSLDNTWLEEDEAFGASNESLCGPPIPPRRPPPLRQLPPVHLPPIYRPPPPPPPTYATARLLLVTDAESESYV